MNFLSLIMLIVYAEICILIILNHEENIRRKLAGMAITFFALGFSLRIADDFVILLHAGTNLSDIFICLPLGLAFILTLIGSYKYYHSSIEKLEFFSLLLCVSFMALLNIAEILV